MNECGFWKLDNDEKALVKSLMKAKDLLDKS